MNDYLFEHVTTITTRRVMVVRGDDISRAQVQATVGPWSAVVNRDSVTPLHVSDSKEETRVHLLTCNLRGRMLDDVKLLGTSLTLGRGQVVSLTPATNLPPSGDKVRFFARPASGRWEDGIERSEQDSVLITEDDFYYIAPSGGRGRMVATVAKPRSDLKLVTGQTVTLVRANEVMPPVYFARPVDEWADKVERPAKMTVLVTEDDFLWDEVH